MIVVSARWANVSVTWVSAVVRVNVQSRCHVQGTMQVLVVRAQAKVSVSSVDVIVTRIMPVPVVRRNYNAPSIVRRRNKACALLVDVYACMVILG